MAETKWTNEQWDAISARDCNLLVAAAAGAGKTAVLVERIIQKITAEENPVDIDRLLVVTFTNAAAAEMRERIAEAVAAVLEKNPENRNIQRQLTLLHKASITTIHSFCLEVIRSNFQSIDIDPGFRISDETEAALMKLEVLDELFEELYEDEEDQDFLELLECYGGNRDDQALKDMVLQLYTFTQSSPWPDKWLEEMTEKFNLSHSLESSGTESSSLESLDQGNRDFSQTSWGQILLGSVLMELESLGQKMAKALEIIQGSYGLEKYSPVFDDEYCEINRLQALCGSQSTSSWDELHKAMEKFSFQRLPIAGKEADKEQQEIVKELRDEVKKSLSKIKDRFFSGDSEEIFGDLQGLYPLLKCLQRLTGEFGRKYALKKSEKSLVDFNDLEHFCLEILTTQGEEGVIRPSPIALGFQERFAEIMVDEYQDSNLVQEIIIQMISRTEPEKPNVFMVGDVKQSIYRFRQAKPELFLEKYHSYSPHEGAAYRKILLYKNFRSRKEVLDGVNFLFKQIMSVSAGELDYTDEEALNPGAVFAEPDRDSSEPDQDGFLIGGEVELHLLETKDPRGNHALHRGDGYQDESDGNGERGDENRESGEENQERGEGNPESGDGEGDESLDPEMLDSIQAEARLVARRILELCRPDQEGRTYAVYDRARKEYRRVEYRDIVILLRTTKNWAEVFSEELALEGIPAFADTGTGFFKTSEVQVILSLLQVIDNPLQDIPLLAVLRSPLFAFTTDELAELRLAQKKGHIYEALRSLAECREPSGQEDCAQETEAQNLTAINKARNFLVSLQKWRKQSLYLPTDQLLWQIYSETGYYGIVGAMPAGEQRQANLRILFERARQYEETSFKGLFNFISFIDKLKSSKGDMGSAKILGENDNLVRIMSIHKSKGLEFPVVILAGCGKKFNLQDMNKSILLHQDLGFGPEIVDYRLRLAYPSLAKQAIREKIKAETLSEEMRILYVAMTRAREKLIITGSVRDLSKGMAKWSACAESKEDKFPPGMILKGEKYLDWIVPALLRDPVRQTRLWSKDDLVNRPAGQSQAVDELEEYLSEEFQSGEFLEEIFHRLNWEYPFIQISRVPAKISVTELKRRYEEEPAEDILKNASDQSALLSGTSSGLLKMKKPLFLEGKKGLSAAEKGTVMHFVMQHLDLGRQDYGDQLKEMAAKDLLTPEHVGSVDTAKIESFVNSSLGQRMLSAGHLAREVPFNLEIPCGEVYRGLQEEECQGETVLLQGVIDCFFEEHDGLVLVDYKTDRLKEDWEEAIRNRYSIQLSYYTKALEMLTGKRVKEKYIYLFQNGEILQL